MYDYHISHYQRSKIQKLFKGVANIFQKFLSAPPQFSFRSLCPVDQNGKILGHQLLGLNGVNNCLLKCKGELLESGVSIKSTSVPEASGPSVDTGDAVGGSGLAFLMAPIVSGDGSMSGLGLDTAIWADEDTGHEAKRSEPLCKSV